MTRARQELEPAPRVAEEAAPPRPRSRLRRLLHPGFPFQPARSPVFYGWVVLVMSVLGVVMSVPGQTIGVSVFTDHLIRALGVTRLQLSNAYLVGTIACAALLPLGGRLLDRFGARVLVVASCVGLGATLVFLSLSDRVTIAVSAGVGLPASAAAVGVLVVGFTALRFSGQGMLTMVSQTMLAKWFQRRRGMAAGVAGVFKSFAFGTSPLVLAGLVAFLGWRGAWIALALAVGVGMSLLGWLFFRDNPEECGLRMDGADPVDAEAAEAEAADDAERSFTRAEALRTLGFWSVTLALSFHALIITGTTFHIVSIGAQAGLGPAEAVAIFLPLALVSTTVGVIVGVISDRARIRYLLAVMMLAQALGLYAMTTYGTPIGRILAVIGLGASGGFYGPLSTVVLPRYFGRRHLGSIAGVQMASMVIGSAIGPSVLALSHGWTGAYHAGFLAFTALPGIVLMLTPFTRNPQKRDPLKA